MKCIIPDVKKKTTFVFGLSLKELAIFAVWMIIAILVLTSTFHMWLKMALIVVVLTIAVICVVPFDVQRGYELIFGIINYWTKRHKFLALNLSEELKLDLGSTIGAMGTHTAVFELNGIDFSVLSVYNQNEKINEFMELLKELKSGKIVKLEKAIEFQKHLDDTLDYIADCEADKIALEIEEKKDSENYRVLDFKTRMLDAQYNTMSNIDDGAELQKSAFYLLVQDENKISLLDTAAYCLERLTSIGFCPKQLQEEELKLFIRRFYDCGETSEDDLDIVLPPVHEKVNKIVLGGKAYRVMCVHKYSPFVGNAWGWELLRIPETKVIINFRNYAGKSVNKLFDKQMLEIKTQLNDPKIKDTMRNQLQGDYYILENLINDIQFGKDKMLDVEFYVMYPAELHKKIMKEFRTNGIVMNDLYLGQYEGYLSMFPYLSMDPKHKQSVIPMPASSLAAMFPFVIKQLDDDKGIYLGGSNGLPVYFNLFHRDERRMNSNIVVLGKPGGGKTFFMKMLLFNYGLRGKRIFILDPENEYRGICNLLGGNYVDVSGSRKGMINPFQVFPAFNAVSEDQAGITEVTQHIQFLEQFFKTILPDLESYALNVLLDLIKTMYENFDIRDGMDISAMSPKAFPTFSDLAILLEAKLKIMEKRSLTEFEIKTIRTLQMSMSKFTNGGIYSTLWNGHTTMDVSNNFNVLNFQTLFANSNNLIANAQMLLIVRFLNQEVIKNREDNSNNVIIAIDEAHRFINSKFPVALDFMQQMAKQVRKYYGSLIVTTQNIDDFVGVSMEMKQKAAGVINSCQYSFIFSLLADDINKIKEMYANYNGGLQEEEIQYIANASRGDALFIVDVNTRLPVHITAFTGEEEYYKSERVS